MESHKNIECTMISNVPLLNKSEVQRIHLQRTPGEKEVYLCAEQDVDGSDGSDGHVEPDVKFKWQTLPVVKPDDLIQDYINKSTNKPTMDTSASEEMDLAFSLACTCEELWSRLDERYGKAEIVHQSFTRRI
ncbi:hypothetical protein DPMN_191994 [Dreissena polymorpha]|uniref:Uncharacterized protein n=1 Tax=Dreissena polymorpha TaxID=45954 RepID=A0A9D4BDA7_DREPO|nr:hypothetical protein DPMN_191994 [Dreissena polymorpha]